MRPDGVERGSPGGQHARDERLRRDLGAVGSVDGGSETTRDHDGAGRCHGTDGRADGIDHRRVSRRVGHWLPVDDEVRFVPDLPRADATRGVARCGALGEGGERRQVVWRVLVRRASGPGPRRGVSEHAEHAQPVGRGVVDRPVDEAPIVDAARRLDGGPVDIDARPADAEGGNVGQIGGQSFGRIAEGVEPDRHAELVAGHPAGLQRAPAVGNHADAGGARPVA